MPLKLLALLLILLTAVQAVTVPEAASDYDYSVKCNTASSTRSGPYCRFSPEVKGNWVWDRAYQLDSNGAFCTFRTQESYSKIEGPCGRKLFRLNW